MKFDSYHIFEMDVTEKEMDTIASFCRFLDEIMDYRDSYEDIYDVINAIAYDKDKVLKEKHVKINIEEEN